MYSTDEEEVFCPSLVTEDYIECPVTRNGEVDEVTGRLPPYYKSW